MMADRSWSAARAGQMDGWNDLAEWRQCQDPVLSTCSRNSAGFISATFNSRSVPLLPLLTGYLLHFSSGWSPSERELEATLTCPRLIPGSLTNAVLSLQCRWPLTHTPH